MRAPCLLGSALGSLRSQDRRRRPRALLMVIVIIALAALLPVGPTRAAGQAQDTRPLAIMTYNLDQGTNFTEVFAAQTPAQFLAAVTTTIQNVRATNPPERMATIARLIAAQRPDVVMLQEVAQWRTGPLGSPASTIEFDFLQLLLDELARLGQPYTTVGVRQGLQIDVPSTLGTTIGFTDRDVIIARSELAPGDFQFANVQIRTFATNVSAPIPGQAAVTVPRGWVSVDVTSRGRTFRIVTSHPEASPPDVEIAEVQELLRGPLATTLPVILAGDLNANATDPIDPTSASYRALLSAGLLDAWTVARPGDPGFTCCQAPDLRNPLPAYTDRRDLVLLRNGFSVVRTQLVGNTPADRTPSGLWPSDHAGLFAALTFAVVAPSQNPPATSGQAGTACAGVSGQTCTAAGSVTGSWTKSGGSSGGTFTFTATGPTGTAPAGVPAIFIPTTTTVESFACSVVGSAAPFVTTCTGTTAGNPLQGATVTVRFRLLTAGSGDITGTITGPGPARLPVVVPTPLPPPPIVLLPPPPIVLLPPPPPVLPLPPVGGPPGPMGPMPPPAPTATPTSPPSTGPNVSNGTVPDTDGGVSGPSAVPPPIPPSALPTPVMSAPPAPSSGASMRGAPDESSAASPQATTGPGPALTQPDTEAAPPALLEGGH